MPAQRIAFVSAVAALVAAACSGDNDATSGAPGSGGSASSAGGGTGAPRGTGGDDFSDTSCDRTACEGFTVGAIGYAACCIPNANACGVRVGNTCVERAAFARRDAGMGGAFDLGDPETVVPDATCPALTSVMGMTVNLPGCCDSTGVCGVSTAGIGNAMGFQIPAMCVTASDPLGSYLATGTPTPCDYPADAGTPPPDGG